MNNGRAVLTRHLERLFGEGTMQTGDARLLECYLSHRDEAAFEALVRMHGPMVLSLCRRFLRDPHDVEDAFQATFLVLVRKGPSLRQRELLSSWLHGVACRVAMRARSNLLKRRARETEAACQEATECSRADDFDDLVPILDQELSRLPEKLRAPLILCYLKDCTHDQAAAELRWPVGTVRSRLARGRELLRERLTRRGCAPTAAILGASPGLSLRPLTASVPPALVRSTVQAANRFASAAMAGTAGHFAISSFSGSSTTLAQGVLTTMALSQIKMFGAGLISAGLVAGSFGAGAWALASPRQDPTPRQIQPPPVAPPPPARGVMAQAPSPPPPTSSPPANQYQAMQANTPDSSGLGGLENRLAELERKLDLLLQQRLGDVNPAVYPSQSAPSRNQRLTKRQVPQAPRSSPPATELPTLPRPTAPAENLAALPPTTGAPLLPPPTAPAENLAALPPQPEPRTVQSPFEPATSLQPAEPINASPPHPVQATPGLPPTPPPPRTEPANQPDPLLPPPAAHEGIPEPVQAPPPAPQNRPEPLGGAIDPFRPSRARSDVLAGHLPDRTSVHEIEAQLAAAIRRYQRAALLFQNHSISEEEYEAVLDQVRLLVGRLKGLHEELSEEIDRAKIELTKKQAELKMAEARQIPTAVLVARNSRLNERKKGVVSQEDVAKDESNDLANIAQIDVKRAEVQEVELRIQQYSARDYVIRQILESTQAAVAKIAAKSGEGATSPPRQR